MATKNRWLVVASAATLIGTATVNTASAKEEVGRCLGVNACKGQSACAGANNSCAGQNSCKGKGWVKTTREACKDQGGTFKPLK